MTDDMKDIGLSSFMFNGNLMDMVENGATSTTTNPVTSTSEHIKQENNLLPPEIGQNDSSNYALPPSTGQHQPGGIGVGIGGYSTFSISASPPQQSPMFMDTINPNNAHNIYGLTNDHQSDFNHHQHHQLHGLNNHDNQFGDGLIKSRLLSTNNGANTIRPSNLPNLRRNASAPSTQTNLDNNSNINNINSNVQYLKHSKSDPNHNNLNNNNNHILTPFDYPLSNPTINASSTSTSTSTSTSSSGAVNHSSHNYYAQYIAQQNNINHINNNIKQENNNNNKNNNNISDNNHNSNMMIHSAPLYSIHSISSSLNNTNSNNSISSHSTHNNNTAHSHSHSHSLSATPTNTATNYNHFSLSSSLLNIPQHLSQNQHPSFPHTTPSCLLN